MKKNKAQTPSFLVGGAKFVADGVTRDINGYPLKEGQIDMNQVKKETLKYQRAVGARGSNTTAKKQKRK